MAALLKVAKADELSPGQARRVEVHGKRHQGIGRYNVRLTGTGIEIEV